MIDPEAGELTYRGCPVKELALRCSFEEVAYLLWHGELPTPDQLAAQNRAERAQRALDPIIAATLMRAALEEIASVRGEHGLIDVCETLARAMFDTTGLHPNLDYPVGPAYHLIGFDTPTFTPILVAARIPGWTATIAAQFAAV